MNILRNNNKNKSLLINQLKINKKSLELLESFYHKKNNRKNKSISSRSLKSNKILSNNKFPFTTNIFSKKLINLKLPNNTIINKINFSNNNHEKIFKKPLTERNNKIFLKTIFKSNHNFKSRNINYSNNNFPSITLSQQNTKRFYTMNINKYKNMLNMVFSRIKSSYKKKKHLLDSLEKLNYTSIKNINIPKRKNKSQLIKRMSIIKSYNNNMNNKNNGKYRSYPKLEDYENTLENEFNCKELIQMENGKIQQKLKQLKLNVYSKTPIYKSNQKLNTHLIRQFNLDKTDQKASFNKKYKIYRASISKIQEIKTKKIFEEIKDNKNPYEQNKLDIEKEILGYTNKDISNKIIKKALNKYYNLKTKNILDKKLELEREMNDLKIKYRTNIEKEKNIKNEYNINFGQLNQIIQSKLLYKEVYETDINKKKKEFYDEHTKILHKVRKWSVPNKIVKKILKQKTINKYKTNVGAYFGLS